MKNIVVTVIVGFIAGLVLSGVIFDVITYIGKSFNRVSVSWNISKAEKFYSIGRFSDSILTYKKVIQKINPENKILLAKTKNNLALSIYENYKITKNSNDIIEALELLKQAENIYLEINDNNLVTQTQINISTIQKELQN